ncbi:snRNA-activating protein complex subunit 4 [Aulostomus maculatus]
MSSGRKELLHRKLRADRMSSLSEERDRIQRQVEKLEQSLSGTNIDPVLLSSETDDQSDEDNSDKDVEQTAAGLWAQREKIQSEIQNLEYVLRPHSPVEVSDDDSSSSSSSELGLSPSVESCLQMNLVYQQVLQDTLNQLEMLLTQNRRDQEEVISHLSGPMKEHLREQPASLSYQKPVRMYLGHFLKPYFKDKLTGLGPPANQETKEKTSKLTGSLDDKKLRVKRWESWQKTLLIHSVARDSLRRLIQPKLSKVDYLTQKLSSAVETDRQQLRLQIDSLEKDIQLLQEKKEEELIGDRYEDHDWPKISNIDFEGTRGGENIRLFWQNFLHPSINKNRWGPEEVKQLRDNVERHEEREWETIAQELGTGRTAFMCLQTFQRFISDTLKRRTWTPEEDTQLRELVDKMRIGNFLPYTQMSYFMEGRDPAQLIYRWNQVLDPRLRKGPWTKQEDKLLLQAVARYGEKSWWRIRLEVPGRTDGACRDRYHDSLKAGTRKGPFDEQEKQLLQQLVDKHGIGRWAKIAAEMPNRHDAQCRNAWTKMTRTPAAPTQRRKRDTSPSRSRGRTLRTKKGSGPTRRTIRRRLNVEEELSSEQDEEEEVMVEYMDSDEELKKEKDEEEERIEKVEKKVLEEEQEVEEVQEFIILPMHEWIPEENGKSFPCMNFQRVMLQSSNDTCSKGHVRSTILGKFGRSVIIGPPPRELRWEERHCCSTMTMVSAEQMQAHLHHQACQLNKNKLQTRKQNHMTNKGLGLQLQASLTPWIGNLLIPATTRLTAADVLRERWEKAQLSSTQVFLLLLQAMNVDTVGCKQIIERRSKQTVYLTPSLDPLSIKKRNPKTVNGILQQRAMQGEKQDLDSQHQLILKQLQVLQLPPPHLQSTLNSPGTLPQMNAGKPPLSVPQVIILPHTTSIQSVPAPSIALPPDTPPYAPLRLTGLTHLSAPPASSHQPAGGCKLANQLRGLSPSSNSNACADHFVAATSREECIQSSVYSLLKTMETPPSFMTMPPPAEVPSFPMTNPGVSCPGPVPHASMDSETSCPQVSSSLNLCLAPPNSMPTNHAASSISSIAAALKDHEYAAINHANNTPDSSHKLPSKAQSRGRKRRREEEQQSVTSSHGFHCVGGTSDRVGRACKGIVQEGKRVRKPSEKAKALQEAKDMKVKAETPTSSPCRRRPRVSHSKSIQQKQHNSMFIMTPGGLVQLTQAQPQHGPTALMPSSSLAPGALLTQPPALPTLPLPIDPVGPHKTATMTVPVNQNQPQHPARLMCPSLPLPLTCVPQILPKTPLPNKCCTVTVDQAAAPPLRREAVKFEPSLMFLESPAEIHDWLSGQRGVKVSGLALPYLPPFVSSLNTLSALLRAKKSLTKTSVQLMSPSAAPWRPCPGASSAARQTCSPLPTPPDLSDSTSDSRGGTPALSHSTSITTDLPHHEQEADLVLATRQLVAERFGENPAYQLLKARFLSCFTLPALLATVQPITERSASFPTNEEEEEEEEEQEEGGGVKMTGGK